jgi:hypothetical protein
MSRVRLLLALTVSVLLLALLPATALSYGYHQDYCGVVKGSGHWCGASGAHSWDANAAAYYDIFANVLVCERIFYKPSESTLEQVCGYGLASSPSHVNRTCVCYEAHVNQNSGYNHTVYGSADA